MIEIFGMPEDKLVCPNCRKAVQLCKDHGFEFKFYPVFTDIVKGKLLKNEPVVRDLMQRLGQTDNTPIQVPQIFVDGKHIGGLQDFRAEMKLFTKCEI